MISTKMIKLTESNSVIRAMFEEGNRLAQLHGRENIYDFSLGNPNIPSPPAIKNAIIDITENEDPIALHGYMSNIGYPAVREAVAKSLNTRFETNFNEKNIIMSSGAAGGLNVVLKTLINPGDEVVVISPFFVEYGNYVNNFDGKLVIVPANPDDFMPNPKLISKAITAKTKAIIINSPNNPTGVIYTKKTIKQLAEILYEKEKEYGSPIYIISDEPYRELVYDGIKVPFITKYYKNTIICYSWSKSLSLPGQRIGYIIIPSEIEDYELIFDAAGIATRILGFVNAPALIQRVAAKCLYEQVNIGAYDTNRKLLYNNLKDLGFEPIYPQGAFYLWLKTPGDDKEFVQAAKKYNILLVPGTAFMCPGYARIAYCVSTEKIENSLPAFKKLAKELELL
ncbi:MAG: pyridoxal phosphate-dependent aminotransferase [Oscillospiraceae bacterium]|jgi:aspartate aminotransferase|nr:pyridoxal phosphate-dependent aminotransferase [Oscillospiraceae bacterium]